jgi:single-stranded-DNA-specific exonuclease
MSSSTDRRAHPDHWRLRPLETGPLADLMRSCGLPEVVAKLLVHRGQGAPDAAQRLLARAPDTLRDPEGLPGMGPACERLSRALDDGETLLIHGDYDVDGVTGTALLVRLFRMLGADVHWHIPNRLVDGYSFGPHSVAKAREVGATVCVSVDNGTSAFETIADLAAAGVDTVVTDHHEPPAPDPVHGELPAAAAIVNPKLPGSDYGWRELCGGAVAFKLAWGLLKHRAGSERVRPEHRRFLEEVLAYVAIATVCDVVPVLDENRVLAHLGLKSLAHTPQVGLQALLRQTDLYGRAITAEEVAFQIGPRINAAGRLGSAQKAVELLLTEDAVEGQRLASELEELNRKRKTVEAEVEAAARIEAERFADPVAHPVLVLAGQGWHQGVVGIVAARLTESFKRPAIVIGLDGESGRGSARTVPGFNVLEAMHGAAEHFERYGGHAEAAGCEITADRVAAARAAIEARAREMLAAGAGGRPDLQIDSELCLRDLTPQLMRQIDRLQPFGPALEKPIFLAPDVRLSQPSRACGADGRHLMLHVRRGTAEFKAMAFGLGHRQSELREGTPIRLVYTPRWNTFRGRTNLELEAHDFCVG